MRLNLMHCIAEEAFACFPIITPRAILATMAIDAVSVVAIQSAAARFEPCDISQMLKLNIF